MFHAARWVTGRMLVTKTTAPLTDQTYRQPELVLQLHGTSVMAGLSEYEGLGRRERANKRAIIWPAAHQAAIRASSH